MTHFCWHTKVYFKFIQETEKRENAKQLKHCNLEASHFKF